MPGTPFSRSTPSDRYLALLEIYSSMHWGGDPRTGRPPGRMFEGGSLIPQLERIKAMVARTGARTLLDYGCGKAIHYGPYRHCPVEPGVPAKRWDSIEQYWGVDSVSLFDPGYKPYSTVPTGSFDGVICSDVMEHIPEQDIDWVVDELFGFARKFVYASIATNPARKRLLNGENAHCTLRPVAWWVERFRRAAEKAPGIEWALMFSGASSVAHTSFGSGEEFLKSCPPALLAPRRPEPDDPHPEVEEEE